MSRVRRVAPRRERLFRRGRNNGELVRHINRGVRKLSVEVKLMITGTQR